MNTYETMIRCRNHVTMADIISTATALVPAAYRFAPWAQPELDHGKGVLCSSDALNCYMAAYGSMHECKMRHLLMQLPAAVLTDGFEIVDWGCGQGLATICLLDLIEQAGLDAVPGRVTLIDASPAALGRAELHVRAKLGPDAEIRCIESELPARPGASRNIPVLRGERIALHLLSNVLDVPGLSHAALAEAIAASGTDSYVACSGHYWCPNYSLLFIRNFRTSGMQPLFDLATQHFGTLHNGHQFSCDLRLFRCGRAA